MAGVCKALQGGRAFKANLDIRITARHNRHCWVAQNSTGRVIIDMEILHSAVIASWPGAVPVVGLGVEGIVGIFGAVPSLWCVMMIVPVTSVPSWCVLSTLSGLQLFLFGMPLQSWHA